MTLPANSFGFNLSKRYVYLFIACFITMTSFSQVDNKSVRPDSEIESAINKMFDESIHAGEQLDLEKMKMQINDKYSAGFINSGKYYTSIDLLFSDYKAATNGLKSQKLTIDNKKITILSGNSVLLTANGQFSVTTYDNKIINGKFFWTIIYKEIDNEWKIIHTHMTNER